MRLRKLTPVVLGAMATLAIAPAGASAFKHSNPSGRCRIDINVAPRVITSGDPIVIWGQLNCRRPADAAGKVVRLFHHLRRVPGITFVQSTTTNVNGFYEFEKPDEVVETNRVYLVRSHRAQSARKPVFVEANVNLVGPPEGTQLYTGRANQVTFTGTVSPADEGAHVILQRQNALTGNEWHGIDRGIVAADGSFTITHAFRYPGDADIRVLVRSEGRNIPSRSNVLTYEISQAQNPALTINSSADPITFGQSVTISGILAGGANQPLTLWARVRGAQFAQVASTTSDSSGNYTFPAQSPTSSTFYRVKGTSVRSAVLFEGVRSLLTAQVTQTTVPAGSPVTFSGTVAPDHTGDAIYLERKDANGNGYHVIQVATIGAGSTYSIEHRFYAAGTKVVRVFVPGGPQNSAAASDPFTIEVTPAPAAALTPESSTNTSLPSEGQTSSGRGEESASGGLEGEPTESESAGSGESPVSTTEGGRGRGHRHHRVR